jgi:nicotinate-nucleotide pyrophosphorylase (carboxylating)
VVASMRGEARSLLAAERTALNFLTHLSGVATQTSAWVRAVAGTRCVVRDTRKTLPGMRLLQKAAVAAGGGTNHRTGLYDALLVKDNHVAAAGGITGATAAALANAAGRHVQVEVDSLDQLEDALAAGARSVLLDNFTLDDTRAAVRRCRGLGGDVFIEASGGLTLDRAREVAETGVDALAVGALTHSVSALDVGLDWH